MSINIVSTTDSAEAVTAAMGDLTPKGSEENKSAPAPKADEKAAASEATTEEPEETESEAETDEEGEGEEPEAKPKRSGFKRRIDKLNAKLSAKDQEVEHWKTQALKNQKPETAKEEIQKPVLEGKPQKDSFESHEAYVEALTDWKVDQKLKDAEVKKNQTDAKTEHQKQVETHVAKVRTFAEAHDDFDELIESIDDVPMSLTVQELILSSDNGPELMYELAKDRKEYERICKLPAIAAAREMGKFESRIKKTETTEEKIVTPKAPPPLKPVGSNKSGAVKKSLDDENLSQRDWERLREEQIAKRA